MHLHGGEFGNRFALGLGTRNLGYGLRQKAFSNAEPGGGEQEGHAGKVRQPVKRSGFVIAAGAHPALGAGIGFGHGQHPVSGHDG